MTKIRKKITKIQKKKDAKMKRIRQLEYFMPFDVFKIKISSAL